eukprot:TRINITY_DN1201_c0_g1_i3.p1 TRINITY_DN1201_c0_g1~~TRINITY_DN1201_c0_g1_i3.p1  ORF type:complete len:132 (+),score=19.27 TRINITY_DN1201_c0_g1_i3:48-443(+)
MKKIGIAFVLFLVYSGLNARTSEVLAEEDHPIDGAYEKQDEKKAWKDPKVKKLIKFGLDEVQKRDNRHLKLFAIKLISYEAQVVAGTNHRFLVDCRLPNSERMFHVTIVVYERSWENHIELLHYEIAEYAY